MLDFKSLKKTLLLSFTFFTLFSAIAITYDQYLYADGAHFLLELFTSKTFFTPIWSRLGANISKEIIPYLALNFGVTDTHIIGYLFGINYYFGPIVGIIISYFIIRDKNASIFIFPFFSFIYLLINQYAYLSVESLYAVSAFWPVYLYLTYANKVDRNYLLTFIGLIILGSSYELTVILYPFVFWSLVTAFKAKRYDRKVILLIIALFAFLGFTYSMYWGLFPENSTLVTNRSDLLNAIQGLFSNITIYLLLLAIICSWILSQLTIENDRIKKRIQYIFLILLVLLALAPTLNISDSGYPGRQWYFRIMVLISTFVFASLHLLITNGKKKIIAFQPRIFLYFSIVAIVYQLQLTWGWSRFIELYNNVLSNKTGSIELQDLKVENSELIKRYAWSWSNPTMSILLESFHGDTINTIIKNDPVKWLPWDPYTSTTNYPDLSDYGKVYDSEALKSLSDSTYLYQVGY